MTVHNRNHKRISYVGRALFAWLIAGLAAIYAQAPQRRIVREPSNDLGQKAIRRMIAGNGFVVHTLRPPALRPAGDHIGQLAGRVRQLEHGLRRGRWAPCRVPAMTR